MRCLDQSTGAGPHDRALAGGRRCPLCGAAAGESETERPHVHLPTHAGSVLCRCGGLVPFGTIEALTEIGSPLAGKWIAFAMRGGDL